ncbi:putative UDP-sugar transporter protein SLC35A4 [Scleropages formosus]|uniref:Putative UDP-sugar transporter protein SLC35A4 n=1 Tax=Scleropages formosus TaxID=113540 RepID=A0A0P7XJQ8_SCLFO|nr:probable UDP-sugar transporter protein SLC35A4 [Scleropages formosus]KPP77072.1 putative UDP-sugar transporter protein SLC35A4 [Scleropages formosus]
MIVISNGSDDLVPPRRRWAHGAGWAALLVLSVVIYGSHAPLIGLSKVDGRVPFSSSSCVVLIELAKLLTSLSLLAAHDLPALSSSSLSWAHAAPYALPALLYALNNNLVVLMQVHMDPSTFQVLSNLKVAFTGLFYCVCLRRRLHCRQWMALILLMGAGACHSYSSLEQEGHGEAGGAVAETKLHISAWGLFLVLSYCSCSGLAAVYTELILKTQRLPLSLQNIFLYVFGVAVNGAAHLFGAGGGQSFLDGYSLIVWVIVLSQAANGLLMSVVMKHGSSITRLFVISCSMLVNAALSWALLGLQLTPLFGLAVLMIGLAVHLYYGE